LRRPFEFTQYTARAFGQGCEAAGVRPSMGSVGDCFDNAMCESFFATLECEFARSPSFQTQSEARMAIFEFIEGLCEMHDENLAKRIAIPEEGRGIEG
jgi:putative transposase